MTKQDDADGTPVMRGEPVGVRLEDLGRRLRTKRKAEGLTLEQVAVQTGLSAATLSRLERQRLVPHSTERGPAPDMRTLSALTHWIGVSIDRVLDSEDDKGDGLQQADSTPDIVEAHLRADRNLDPKTAAVLGRMFRAAYEQFAESDINTHE